MRAVVTENNRNKIPNGRNDSEHEEGYSRIDQQGPQHKPGADVPGKPLADQVPAPQEDKGKHRDERAGAQKGVAHAVRWRRSIHGFSTSPPRIVVSFPATDQFSLPGQVPSTGFCSSLRVWLRFAVCVAGGSQDKIETQLSIAATLAQIVLLVLIGRALVFSLIGLNNPHLKQHTGRFMCPKGVEILPQ
jgi:hypothetical protein